MADTHKDRREALLDRVGDDVATVLVPPGETMRYLTGLNMHVSERPTALLLQPGESPAFVLPALETGRVEDAVGSDVAFFVYGDATDSVAAAQDAFAEFRHARDTEGKVAMEFRAARLMEYELVEDAFDWDAVVDLEDASADLRARKDDTEIDRLQTAAAVIDEVLEATVSEVEPGVTEADVEAILHKRVIDSEADSLGLVIVVSGPRSAKPHTSTTDREIEHGDPLMIDAGVVVNGYYSDITRTFAVGEAGEEFEEIYDVVREAAANARDTVAEGVPLQDVDRASREVIEDAGYGDYYPHRVGHGLGLSGHEPPYLVEGNEATLEVGNAFTVEPGVYVDGHAGVRIEDDVVLTEDGPEVLTAYPRELQIL